MVDNHTDNNMDDSHSFLLFDDSSIPFSLDDIAALMEDKVRAASRPLAPSALRARLAHTHSFVAVHAGRPIMCILL